ncbi:MAG TPA: LysR family transcriptional regulator [Tetrasphaera sp.]|uniref:LysR family transcriptional regulator n=1 Tax=Nostocoides sp. TaxID=1917966 RepID=UPI002D065054|nr:LysR family transcriptional regulator [Tetrasphaera sp.]HNQ08518.1 LysR family transcriptional regulator [Tetrasphaera sp.]
MIDMTRLRVFRAVVHAGTVHAAAANLGYSPSSVSQHINALQRETGLTLFEKSGRGITPTPAGLALAEGSEEIMSSFGRLTGLVEDLREGRTGTLTIGTFPSAGQYLVPQVARTLAAEFPSLLLNLDLIDVIDGPRSAYDIELRAEDPTLAPTSVDGHRRFELLVEPYVVVLPRDHPLAAMPQIGLADLAGERLIAEGMADTTCSGILRRAYAASGANPRYVARTSDHHAAVALVSAGVGLTLLPRLAMGRLSEDLLEREVAGEAAPSRRIVAFVSEAAAPRRAVIRALHVLREIARSREAAAA